jgi:hypothetical protein
LPHLTRSCLCLSVSHSRNIRVRMRSHFCRLFGFCWIDNTICTLASPAYDKDEDIKATAQLALDTLLLPTPVLDTVPMLLKIATSSTMMFLASAANADMYMPAVLKGVGELQSQESMHCSAWAELIAVCCIASPDVMIDRVLGAANEEALDEIADAIWQLGADDSPPPYCDLYALALHHFCQEITQPTSRHFANVSHLLERLLQRDAELAATLVQRCLIADNNWPDEERAQ